MRSFLKFIRRQRQRWLGQGPWHAQPLAEIFSRRQSLGAWHAPESCDGVIAAIPHPAIVFPSAPSLLGQSEQPFILETGERRFSATNLAVAHTTTFWSLGSVGVLGDEGLIYCPDLRTAVAETARGIYAAPHAQLLLHHPVLVTGRLSGVSLLLAGPFGHAHYHLLWDLLTKFALLPPQFRAAVQHYLVSAPENSLTQDWLHAAGIPLERVVWLKPRSHLLCEQLVFSNLPCEVIQPRPAVHAALATLFQTPPPTGARRWLWLSRRGLARRDLKWEAQLLQALPQFECVDTTTLSARDQIRLFAEAGVVAGPHGSGFANLAFVHGCGDVVEFFPVNQHHDPVFARLTQVIGWRHHWAAVDFDHAPALDPIIAALRQRLPSP